MRYKQAFDKYIAEKGYTDIKTLVAFSGTVSDPDAPDVEYTEVGMNQGIREKELPERFATDEYQVLLVAEKYQTGFDQPLLHTMYVDKRLPASRRCRRSRASTGPHPGKEDTFVLDFVNEPEEILERLPALLRADPRRRAGRAAASSTSSRPSWTGSRSTTRREVEEFCKVFYKPRQQPDACRPRADERVHRSRRCDRFNAA